MSYAENKKTYFDYEILEKFEAGLSLRGFEVKAVIDGKASLKGGRVIIRNKEAFLVGVSIAEYQTTNTPKDYDQERPRKLLLHKKEIDYLYGKEKERGLTLVPLKLYNKNKKVKLEFAVVRGKKKYDKRESIKKKEAKRKIERTLKDL